MSTTAEVRHLCKLQSFHHVHTAAPQAQGGCAVCSCPLQESATDVLSCVDWDPNMAFTLNTIWTLAQLLSLKWAVNLRRASAAPHKQSVEKELLFPAFSTDRCYLTVVATRACSLSISSARTCFLLLHWWVCCSAAHSPHCISPSSHSCTCMEIASPLSPHPYKTTWYFDECMKIYFLTVRNILNMAAKVYKALTIASQNSVPLFHFCKSVNYFAVTRLWKFFFLNCSDITMMKPVLPHCEPQLRVEPSQLAEWPLTFTATDWDY